MACVVWGEKHALALLFLSFLLFISSCVGTCPCVLQFRVERSKWEKLESRKRVKASLEARTRASEPLAKPSSTSAPKQVRGGQPPPTKLSCKFNVNLSLILSYLI